MPRDRRRRLEHGADRPHLRPHEVAPSGEERLSGVVAVRAREGKGQPARIPRAEGPPGQHESSRRLPGFPDVLTGGGSHSAGGAVRVGHADDEGAFIREAVVREKRSGGAARHGNLSEDCAQRADGVTRHSTCRHDEGEIRVGISKPLPGESGRLANGNVGVGVGTEADRHFQLGVQLRGRDLGVKHGHGLLRRPCQGQYT